MLQKIHNVVNSYLFSTTASLSQARQAHAQLLKTGFFDDIRLATRLLYHYANHQCFSDANLVLDSAPQPDFLSYSTLINAFSKFNHFNQVLCFVSKMLSRGIVPDERVLPCAFKACAGLQDLRAGQQVHGITSVSGLDSDLFVNSSLLHMYLKCNLSGDAHKVFAGMPQKDVVIWSALISGYSRQGHVDMAKKLFNEMRKEDVKPNLVTWNGMIAGCNSNGSYVEAMTLFQQMYAEGFQPDESTISNVLPAVGELEYLVLGNQMHSFVIKQGLETDSFVVSALIDMYGRCRCTLEMSQVFHDGDQTEVGSCNAFITGLSRNGLVDTALKKFSEFKSVGIKLNVVSWTSIVSSCSQNGKDMEALQLFREMQVAGMEPNFVTIPCVLPACGNVAAVMHGKAIHCFTLRKGIFNNLHVGSALIDMYSKCGKIQLAQLCFDNMLNRNLVAWNAMMNGYAMHGHSKETIDMFLSLLQNGLNPDAITITSVLSACCQNGLTDEGWYYFNSMSKEHGIEPRLEHYACMVTLLSRVGKLEEAYTMIKEMPSEPDACIWGALLSSCRIHHNLELGKIAAERLFQLEPENPGNYILLSNIYASKGLWSDVNRVRYMMKSNGIRKNPGCSWIEIKNNVHMLLAGDDSNPQMNQIMEKLGKLSIEMKKLGYLPETDFVLQDVEEQDKEQILSGHSEKLAAVFGLLNTPSGSPLQIIKNLRICGDCHAFMKFVSIHEEREISVRDTNRFHHFRDGICSCGDYW